VLGHDQEAVLGPAHAVGDLEVQRGGKGFDLVGKAVSTGNGTVIPAGVYILIPQVNVSIIASTSNTSNSTVLPANTGGVILSDGVNVFAKTTNSGGDTVTLLATNGGQNVSSTFAS
jgi:hypothetical protein